MYKRIYISADYDSVSGDRIVINELNKWNQSNQRVIDFVDMAQVISGSVALSSSDCRPCDLKAEFNRQINASSIAVFIVGDKTKIRASGSSCGRASLSNAFAMCTPYKYNTNGQKWCNKYGSSFNESYYDVSPVNCYSYLRHEFEQAKKRNKKIVILYNSTRYETAWLPRYMDGFENVAYPFWTTNAFGQKVGNYALIKRLLGYED